MKLNITYSAEAEKMAIQFADAAEMKPPCSAELIFGRFSDEDTNYYNLAFPADYKLDNDLPYFFIGTIRVVITNRKLVEHIDNKKFDFVECNFVFHTL